MGLEYPGEWKFEGVGFGVPPNAAEEFFNLLLEIGGSSKGAIESFKSAFGSSGSSSSLDWAVTDLSGAMTARATNAAAFVDSVWSSIESAKELGLKVPSAKLINKILEKHAIPLVLDPPNLNALQGDAVIVERITSASTSSNPTPLFKLGDKIGSGGYGVVYKATRGTAVSLALVTRRAAQGSPKGRGTGVAFFFDYFSLAKQKIVISRRAAPAPDIRPTAPAPTMTQSTTPAFPG